MTNRTPSLTTRDEAIAYFTTRISSRTRYTFHSGTRFASEGEPRKKVYYLQRGSGWTATCIRIEDDAIELGERLDAAWKRNQYGSPVGAWGAKKILATMGVSTAEIDATASEQIAKDKRRMKVSSLERQIDDLERMTHTSHNILYLMNERIRAVVDAERISTQAQLEEAIEDQRLHGDA